MTRASGPGGTDDLDWQEFQTRPVVNRQVQFTGFGDDGNGWEILNWLRDHGHEAYGRENPDTIFLTTDDRAEATAYVGWGLVIGTRSEAYFIRPDVHDEKYVRVQG